MTPITTQIIVLLEKSGKLGQNIEYTYYFALYVLKLIADIFSDYELHYDSTANGQ